MLKNFFKSTFRNLWKNKGYSFLNIGGLAIGIACAGLIFLWVGDELTWDNMNVKKSKLYSIQVNANFGGNMFTMGSTPRVMGQTIKAEIPGIANTCRISDGDQMLLFSFGDKAVYATGRYADPSLFTMLTLQFVQGDAKNAFSQLYSVVITEKTAKKFFGNAQNVIGKTVRVDNQQDYVITGVLKDLPENSTLQAEWLAPYAALMQQNKLRSGNDDDARSWNSFGPFTYVELEPNANLGLINSKLHTIIHEKEATQKNTAFLFQMSDWHLYSEFSNGKQTGGGRIKRVHMLSLIAWVVLLIACINFMNLATARSEKRAREVGVRKVLGAEKKGLIARFIGEALTMSAIAAILAVAIMYISLPAFKTVVQKQLSLDITEPVHAVALLCIVVICGLVAGSYPTLYLSSFNPVNVLKGLRIKTGGVAFIRKGMVVFQFTVSVVFIISTIIIYRQIQHAKTRNLGFNKDNLIEVDMQHWGKKNFAVIKQQLLATGLVTNAAASDHVTIEGGNTDNRFTWEGKAHDNISDITFRNVSPEFVATSGMQIIQGRDFMDKGSDSLSVIVTQSLAKIIDKNGVVGRIIQSPRGVKEGGYKNLRIVGVVKDYVFGNMYEHAGVPVIFLCGQPSSMFDSNLLYVRLKDQHNSQQALANIAAVIKKNNPAYPFQYRFVDDQFNAMFMSEVLMSKLSTIFASLAIFISCLGMFSLAAYTAERRIKEIGIRKVLGASVSGITVLLSKDFLQLVGISCLVAFPIAWWMMHSWLQNYEYRITISWWIFLLAAVSAIGIALVTISFQSIKAAMANPVKSLRSE
jgi:putative ABC transport system permease protein